MKQCDEEKPACRRCVTRGKLCEGYERFATFVNRTPSGLERRERLEEAIRSTQGQSSRAVLLPQASQHELPFPQWPTSTDFSLEYEDPRWPDQWLMDKFMEVYKPKDSWNQTGCILLWLKEAIALSNPPPLLHHALRALAANQVARIVNDDELANQGLAHCGEALALLGKQLQSDDANYDDETMAAIRLLMIFELFESTSASVVAWGSHQLGLARMCTLRGPENFESPFAKNLLLDIKNVNMIFCTQYSLPTVFGNPRWHQIGDPTGIHDLEHRAYDIAFRMSTILQREKQASTQVNATVDDLVDLVERLNGMVEALEELLELVIEFRPPEMAASSNPFWNLDSANLVANILTLNINASFRIHDLLFRLQGQEGLTQDSNEQLTRFREFYSTDRAEKMVQGVIETTSFMIGDEMGLYGGQRSLYPVRMTLCKLPDNFAGRDQVLYLYGELIKRKGIRHAQDLNKVWGEIRNTPTEYGAGNVSEQ